MFDFEKRLLKNIDWWLIGSYIAISIIGLFAVSSATHTADSGFMTYSVKKQLIAMLFSTIVMFVIMCMDYRIFYQMSLIIYIGMILSLISVFIIGTNIKGSQRWIMFGPASVQPSEFAKIFLVLSLAKLIDKKRDFITKLPGLALIAVVVLFPIALIYKQPDLGTSLVIVFMVIIMLIVAGLPMRYLGYFTVAGVGLMPVAWHFMKDYQRNRILVFLNPENDPLGAGYNIIQAKIAIGSGNWARLPDSSQYVYRTWGKGLFTENTLTSLKFIPEQFTDFVFSVIGEGLGFWGSFLLIGIFCFVVVRCIYIGMKAKDYYGALVVSGFTGMFMFHILENIGMNLGLMPVTGLPLPFVSYGGSSFLVNAIALGIILNIGMRHKKIQF